MKTANLFFFACFGLLQANSLSAQTMWQIKSDEVKKWHYAAGDEFNNEKVNTDKWNYSPDWGSAVPKQSVFYTEGANVYQADGAAHFVLKKERYYGHVNPWELDSVWVKKNNIKIENDNMWFDYTTGQLISKEKFKYGYFECRFKSNDERGIWPAFWLYAGHDNDEIDWFELKCEKSNQVHVDSHCPDGCDNYRGGFMKLTRGFGGWIKMTQSLSKDYNVISGEWNENYLIWYLNGVPMCYFKHKYEFPMWLILNTTIAADNSGGFSPGPDASTKFPNEYIVDYVRIWTKEDTLKNNFQAGFQSNFKASESTIKETRTVTFLPLSNSQYSLTFLGAGFRDAKIEIQDNSKKKVREYNLTDPSYFILDVKELENGSYSLIVNTAGKTLTEEFTVRKMTR